MHKESLIAWSIQDLGLAHTSFLQIPSYLGPPLVWSRTYTLFQTKQFVPFGEPVWCSFLFKHIRRHIRSWTMGCPSLDSILGLYENLPVIMLWPYTIIWCAVHHEYLRWRMSYITQTCQSNRKSFKSYPILTSSSFCWRSQNNTLMDSQGPLSALSHTGLRLCTLDSMADLHHCSDSQ